MNENTFNLSGWLMASGNHLSGVAHSGTVCFRKVHLSSSGVYATGYVSYHARSFKRSGELGNWYGRSVQTIDSEVTGSENCYCAAWNRDVRYTYCIDALIAP
jgi:hypothetical protein